MCLFKTCNKHRAEPAGVYCFRRKKEVEPLSYENEIAATCRASIKELNNVIGYAHKIRQAQYSDIRDAYVELLFTKVEPMRNLVSALTLLFNGEEMQTINFDGEKWITIKGTPVLLDENGDLSGSIGKKIESETNKNAELSPEVTKLMGQEFTGVKGQDAINKLLKEKQGHVKGAFHRNGVGDIDLLWGKGGEDGFGLAHIIEERNSDGFDGESFLYEIPNVIRNGKLGKRTSDGRFTLTLKDKSVIISPELRGDRITFLLTAYEKY